MPAVDSQERCRPVDEWNATEVDYRAPTTPLPRPMIAMPDAVADDAGQMIYCQVPDCDPSVARRLALAFRSHGPDGWWRVAAARAVGRHIIPKINIYGPVETAVIAPRAKLARGSRERRPIGNARAYIPGENKGRAMVEVEDELCVGGAGAAGYAICMTRFAGLVEAALAEDRRVSRGARVRDSVGTPPAIGARSLDLIALRTWVSQRLGVQIPSTTVTVSQLPAEQARIIAESPRSARRSLMRAQSNATKAWARGRWSSSRKSREAVWATEGRVAHIDRIWVDIRPRSLGWAEQLRRVEE